MFPARRDRLASPLTASGVSRRRVLSLVAGAAAIATLPLPARAVARPPMLRRLRLFNAHTKEAFDGAYRDDDGPIARVMQELSVFFRDFHRGEARQMDVGVLDFLADVMGAVGETGATVLSAYRTPQTNAMLARTTFGVAEHSQHMYGRALDIHLGSRLIEAVAAARAMKRGGVGWYPHSGFIHIDTGPVRNWTLAGDGFRSLLDDAHITGKRDRGRPGPRRSAGPPANGAAAAPAEHHSQAYLQDRSEFLAHWR